MADWPDLQKSPDRYYALMLAPALALRVHVHTGGQKGSGKPSGPRHPLWAATVTQALGSLEAGLEDVVLAAHGRRLGLEGLRRDGRFGSWLAEDQLMAPGPEKIEKVMLMHFGIDLDPADRLPPECRFRPLVKKVAGAGVGTPGGEIATWKTLRELLSSAAYVRNATAHHDIRRLSTAPTLPHGEGYLWALRKSGVWSVQQPHATNALRTSVATYNFVALRIYQQFGHASAAVRPVTELVPTTP